MRWAAGSIDRIMGFFSWVGKRNHSKEFGLGPGVFLFVEVR